MWVSGLGEAKGLGAGVESWGPCLSGCFDIIGKKGSPLKCQGGKRVLKEEEHAQSRV